MKTWWIISEGEDIKIRARNQEAAEKRFTKEHPGRKLERILERIDG